ncbi:hypothetical protein, partial [Reinekea sp.]|uniref:hypothetical protein n=1 Tax=Reinekea sp. TaxID=1970455 RepID=UPI002A7F7A36
EGDTFGGIMSRTAAAGMVGGITAELTGGSFEDGLQSAAFTQLFNDNAMELQSIAQRYISRLSSSIERVFPKKFDPHAGHSHTGPGGNPNPDRITQKKMIEGAGTWKVNVMDRYHQNGVDPAFPNAKYNDAYGHEEVFDFSGNPVRDENGPTFNRHTGNLNPLHFGDMMDWKMNGTGWPDDTTTTSDRCLFFC